MAIPGSVRVPSQEAHRRTLLATAFAIGLTLGAVAYCGFGVIQLTVGTGDYAAVDLARRWRDTQYVFQGQNPYDILAVSQGKPAPEGRNARIDPSIGRIIDGAYPPWSFATSFLLVPPLPYGQARLYFAVVSLLALGWIARWCFRIGRLRDTLHGWLFAAGGLAITGNFFCLSAGQYSIVINALLIASLQLHERGRNTLAGIALGMAMIKPQIAALFVVAFVLRGQWKVAMSAALYLVAASALVSWQIGTSVFELLAQMSRAGHEAAASSGGYGPFNLLLRTGVEPKLAVLLLAIPSLVIASALMFHWRRHSMLLLFAVAATIGRLWTYHGVYDNPMLLFLLLALACEWYTRPNGLTTVALLLVGLTLWTPLSYGLHLSLGTLQLFHVAAWLFGLTTLLFEMRQRGDSPAHPTQDVVLA
jgi:hypothetical protein